MNRDQTADHTHEYEHEQNCISETEVSSSEETDFYQLASKKDSSLFYEKLSSHFPDFINNLTDRFQNINSMDLKVCALIKLDFSTKDIAAVTGSTIRGNRVTQIPYKEKVQAPFSRGYQHFHDGAIKAYGSFHVFCSDLSLPLAQGSLPGGRCL